MRPTTPPASSRLEAPRCVVAFCFAAVGLWYLGWRLGTLNPHAPFFSGLIYAAELFGFITALLHHFMCWRLSEREAPPPRAGIAVDVFIPTYGESVELVRKTLLAAMAMDYPHRTWLLDDGRRPPMRALARDLGCEYLTRPDNLHAKAGNLNHALAHTQGELIAVFDADHAPRRDFLVRTLGYFDDPGVAFVQTPQEYYNLDSYQHRKPPRSREVWTEQALFFRVIQRGKDYWNAAFFCGSCALVRRSALERVGGFATGTITEDLHTSIRLHAAGYRSVYHAEPLAFGLAPESIEPFITQRVRWGQGAMHVWRNEGILGNRGLTFVQRLNYFASVATYFDGWQKAVFYFAPVVVLITGKLPLLTALPAFLLHFVPYYLLTFWTFEEVGRGYGGTLYIEQYNMARFAAFAWATLAWFFPTMRFRVTRKGARARRLLRFTVPQWLVVGSNLLAIPAGIALWRYAHTLPLASVAANTLWAAINAGLAGAVLRHTLSVQRRRRLHYRFPVPLPAELEFAGMHVRGTIDDLSARGVRFYGPLPAGIAPDSRFEGRLTLPDGPLKLTGHVRNLFALADRPGVFTGFGGEVQANARDEQRIERFLFGSNMQWLVNGYCDQSGTPLSFLLPARVPGPHRSAFRGVHWNAAEVTGPDGRPAQALLSFTTATPARHVWLLSFIQLPENQPLRLQCFRRSEVQSQTVLLRRADARHQPGPAAFVYSVVGIQRHLIEAWSADERRPDEPQREVA
jgi:cellulose synthase (UDP-forming)